MRYWGLCFIFLACLITEVCAAQPKDADKISQLKEQAELYYNDGKFQKAADLLQEAYLLSRSVDFLYALGRCYAELQRWSEASQSFDLYLSLAPTGAFQKDAKEELEASQRKLKAQNEALLVAKQEKDQTKKQQLQAEEQAKEQARAQAREAELRALEEEARAKELAREARARPIIMKRKQASRLLLGSVIGATAGLALGGGGLYFAQRSFTLNEQERFSSSRDARETAVALGLSADIILGLSLSTAVVSAVLYRQAALRASRALELDQP